MPSNVVVMVNEEYDYRLWRWDTGMTAEDLVAFWLALETIEGDPADSLPGHWEELDEIPEGHGLWSAHIDQDDNSWLRDPEGEKFTHFGYER